MRRRTVLLAMLVLSVAASAQDVPRAEVFGGYSLDLAGIPFSTGFNIGTGQANLPGRSCLAP